jgi:hypothetical protein
MISKKVGFQIAFTLYGAAKSNATLNVVVAKVQDIDNPEGKKIDYTRSL